MKETRGNVILWNNDNGNFGSVPEGYNVVAFDDLALKADITKSLLISTLGIVTAADDAAANTAGVLVGGLYYTGTVLQVRLA